MDAEIIKQFNKLENIEPADPEVYDRILKRWDGIAKPLRGMGRFEEITAGIGAVLHTDDIDIRRRAAVVMCADNGIVKEGISQSGQDVTAAVGGLDIAGLTGLFIGGALYNIPIVIDGFISAVAALAADRILPGTKDVMIASHLGREEGMKYILDDLNLKPVIDADMALGEGTGAVMLFPLLDTVLELYNRGLKLQETEVDQYRHF